MIFVAIGLNGNNEMNYKKEILDQINSFIKKNATFYISHSGGKYRQ